VANITVKEREPAIMGLFSSYDIERQRILDNAVRSWYNASMNQEPGSVTKAAVEPDVTKVGPHGYIHGWIKVGAGDISRDTSTGDVTSHGSKIGEVHKLPDGSYSAVNTKDPFGHHDSTYDSAETATRAIALSHNFGVAWSNARNSGTDVADTGTGMSTAHGYLHSGQWDKLPDTLDSVKAVAERDSKNQQLADSLGAASNEARYLKNHVKSVNSGESWQKTEPRDIPKAKVKTGHVIQAGGGQHYVVLDKYNGKYRPSYIQGKPVRADGSWDAGAPMQDLPIGQGKVSVVGYLPNTRAARAASSA
jgi:hypothetical protein